MWQRERNYAPNRSVTCFPTSYCFPQPEHPTSSKAGNEVFTPRLIHQTSNCTDTSTAVNLYFHKPQAFINSFTASPSLIHFFKWLNILFTLYSPSSSSSSPFSAAVTTQILPRGSTQFTLSVFCRVLSNADKSWMQTGAAPVHSYRAGNGRSLMQVRFSKKKMACDTYWCNYINMNKYGNVSLWIEMQFCIL